MQLTQETDYALRLILAFSRQGSEDLHTTHEISEGCKIPYRFLLRIMKKLKKAGIVASRQGVDGGYRLGRDPSAISYYDVIEAVENGIFISRCLKNPMFCNANRLPECAVHYGLAEVQESLVRELKAKNFGAPSHRK